MMAGGYRPAGGGDALLGLVDVDFRYRGASELALRDVSFAVQPGRSLGIVGESGSGKTTALSLLLGLLRPTRGEVRVDGRTLDQRDRGQLRQLRCMAQPVYQDPYSSLDPRQRVDRIVAEPLRSLRIEPDVGKRRAAVVQALSDVGLDADAALRYPHEFSGGQRQRIAIARALVAGPRVLLADEPVSALDVTTRIEVIRVLDELRRTRDLTIVMVSHDLAVVAALCDDLVVLDGGRVVEAGQTLDVLRAPREPRTRQLVAAVPRIGS